MLGKSMEGSQRFTRGEEHGRDTKEVEQKRSETGDKEWSESECLEVVGPSNAFGQIEFITESTSNHKPTEFVRISDEDKLEDVMILMKNYWKMMEPEKPSLCISVIGGAKNFVLEGHKKEVFYSGLVQAAQTTRAWIVTSGLNLGIIRVVGDALQEQSYSTDKRMLSQQLRCIGIAPWGYVLNRNTLVANNYEDHFHPIPYTVSTVIETGQPVSLNQNHTHYIFVDEGKRLRYGGCESARFRARLEKQIALPEEAGGFGIPVVLVIVEGGHDVFIDARNSIKERVPVVICSGTGRAADILDMAFNFRLKHHQFTSFTERECSILSQKLKIVSGKNKVEAALKMIQFIVQDTKLITTFDMNKSDDLDLAILFALIKTSSELDKQLRLALTWDRSDIAEAKIFRQGKQVKPEILEPIMMEALLRNKTDFVRILLQNGVVMRQFLTFERLHRLYNESTQSNDLIRCLKNYKLLTSEHLTVSSTKLHLPVMMNNEMTGETEQSFTPPSRIYLSTICKLLRRMLGRYTNKIYDMDTELLHGLRADWNRELFLWAILYQRHKMALYFWERSEDSLTLALIACCLYTDMIKLLPTYDTEGKTKYETYVEEFESLAIGVLEECNGIDPEFTLYLVEGESSLWGGFNCLQLAAQSVRRKFISSQACQNSLDFAWCHGMRANMLITSAILILPFLLYFDHILSWEDKRPHVSVNYNHRSVTRCTKNAGDVLDQESISHQHSKHSAPVQRNFKEKIKMFYTAPKTKFCLYTMVYVIFLLFFSYTLLFSTIPDRITIHEGFIMAYFIAMIIDIIRQIFLSPGDGPKKIATWWDQYEWGRSELFVILLALLSMFLRIGLNRTFIYSKTFYVLTSNNNTCGTNADGINCPKYHFLCPLFLAMYLMIAGTLLINLLIAIFSNVFNEIEFHSIELWKYNMFFMVVEFNKKPIVPVPLSAVQALIELILYCTKMSKVSKKNVKSPRSSTSGNLKFIVKSETEDERDDGAKLFKFTERGNRRPSLGPTVSFSQLSPNHADIGLMESVIPESLQHNCKEQEAEDNDDEDDLRRVRVFEANCKRNILKKMKLDREKTIEAGIRQLKARLEEMFSSLMSVGEKVESVSRDIEFFSSASEIKSTEKSTESTNINVQVVTEPQKLHTETPVISINDQISTVLQQHPVETSKLNPVEYPEVGSSESEMEFIFDVSEPPEVLPVSSQLRKSSRISPSSNILLNVEHNINDNYIFYDKLS
ncbi:transient receptor potential cation channel subfamily M member 3 [Schistosoma bovis]|uniref:Transient receptor potential cation channel subfamily M member 3 n=1 Tax=Schistosoma bovis TaxID=6184 RepID=A0A430QLJ9_SCHBO|nr:transient receptor potential cation channel subfamily M member 3 [Schistosoma bovis]